MELTFFTLADGLAKLKDKRDKALSQTETREPVTAIISEYEDHGTYVWVDYGDGEELAKSLEDVGQRVIRVRSQTEHEPN